MTLYIAYVVYLVLAASQHDALEPFSAAMLWFVLPITALWIIALLAMRSACAAGGGRAPTPSILCELIPSTFFL